MRMFQANGKIEAPLITPTRSSNWSVDATTLRSTQTTRTTGALTNGSVSRAGGGVRSMATAATLAGSIVFQGLSPAWTRAAERLAAGAPPAESALTGAGQRGAT